MPIISVLAQLVPAAGVETLLYSPDPSNNALIQELAVCNRGAVTATFRFSISILGGATQTKDFLYFDMQLPANETFASELGVTIRAEDVIRVLASNGNLTFTILGAVT